MESELNFSIVESISVNRWGSEVEVRCLDDPVDRNAHTLVFKGCSELRYLVHEPECVNESEDNLIGIELGEGDFLKPAVITGGIFELWINYKSVEIE